MGLDKHSTMWYNINMNDNISVPQIGDKALFRTLVLQPGTFTLAAIRERMHPTLEGIDDIELIRKMIEIRNKEIS